MAKSNENYKSKSFNICEKWCSSSLVSLTKVHLHLQQHMDFKQFRCKSWRNKNKQSAKAYQLKYIVVVIWLIRIKIDLVAIQVWKRKFWMFQFLSSSYNQINFYNSLLCSRHYFILCKIIILIQKNQGT